MKQNIGRTERRIRRLVGWALITMVIFKIITGVWMWVAIFTSIILITTAFIHHCPLYKLLGINTNKTISNNKI
jgi:hypothetical protein